MCKLVLDKGSFVDFTSVSNVFIDEYMPKANGEFVKVYLHLLRLVSDSSVSLEDALSTEKIADKFNLLESDVVRCFHYWADQGLLSLSFNDMGEISGIKLESVVKSRYILKGIEYNETETLAKVSGESVSRPVPTAAGVVIPAKKKYSAKELASISSNDAFETLSVLAETNLGKTLNSTDINSLIYMLNDLALDPEFIIYIMETVTKSGSKTMSAIEKRAIEYVKKNILSVEEAKMDEQLRSSIVQSIYKIFGKSPKVPIKKDMDFISKWTGQYGFSDEIILEACNRTMEYTDNGSFKYADSILENWFEKNATSFECIEKLDKAHSEELNKSLKPKITKTTKVRKVKSFDQRTYDYNDLEMQLIANRSKKLKAGTDRN